MEEEDNKETMKDEQIEEMSNNEYDDGT